MTNPTLTQPEIDALLHGEAEMTLIDRLEVLCAPDRELDAEILIAAFGIQPRLSVAPRYTSSLDAAVTLVPNGFQWQIRSIPTEETMVHVAQVDWRPPMNCQGYSPAIALCIAALKARGVK